MNAGLEDWVETGAAQAFHAVTVQKFEVEVDRRGLLTCFLCFVYRWWASWVILAVFHHSRNMTSPFHHCTAPWTLHLMLSQPAAASVQLNPPLRQWTAFRRHSPTALRHTAPLATAWTQLWLPLATSTVSMARVSFACLLRWANNGNILMCIHAFKHV